MIVLWLLQFYWFLCSVPSGGSQVAALKTWNCSLHCYCIRTFAAISDICVFIYEKKGHPNAQRFCFCEVWERWFIGILKPNFGLADSWTRTCDTWLGCLYIYIWKLETELVCVCHIEMDIWVYHTYIILFQWDTSN